MSVNAPPAPTIRILLPEDAAWLVHSAREWHSSYRWKLKGRTPSPEFLSSAMWESVTTQWVVIVDGFANALLQVHDLDLRNGIGYLSLTIAPDADDHVDLRGSITPLIASVFDDFPVRKLYLHVLAGVEEETILRALPGEAEVEATLREHERAGTGAYASLRIVSLGRPAAAPA